MKRQIEAYVQNSLTKRTILHIITLGCAASKSAQTVWLTGREILMKPAVLLASQTCLSQRDVQCLPLFTVYFHRSDVVRTPLMNGALLGY